MQTPGNFLKSYLRYILNVRTSPKMSLSVKQIFFGFLDLLIHLLQKLNLLLKHVVRKLSCCSDKSSTGKFRGHCSQDQETPISSEAIACQFVCIYLSAVSANLFEPATKYSLFVYCPQKLI